jgi:hypothetical protein
MAETAKSKNLSNRNILWGVLMWLPFNPDSTDVGYLYIQSTPPGAVVLTQDRAFRGVTPATVDLSPAKYQLLLQKKGYLEKTVEVELKSGNTAPLDVTLQKTP